MTPSILFLEDRYSDRTWRFLRWIPERIKSVVTASNAEQAFELLDRFAFTHVFLDHDLDWIGTWPTATNGMRVVDKIIKSNHSIDKIIVHSTSGAGLEMTKRLVADGYNAVWLPFEQVLMKMKPDAVLT